MIDILIKAFQQPEQQVSGRTHCLETVVVGTQRKIRQSGLIVRAGFIVGFDADTPRIFEEQFEFISAAAIPVATAAMVLTVARSP